MSNNKRLFANPIFAAAAAPFLGHALAVATELDSAETRLRLVTPPEHIDAALADVKRRAEEMEQRVRVTVEGGHPMLRAYRLVTDEMIRDEWQP